MFITICSGCKETNSLIRTALERRCLVCKKEFNDYIYVGMSALVLDSVNPENSSRCFRDITDLLENCCLFVEITKSRSSIEVTCPPKIKNKVNELLLRILKRDVIELPETFVVPPMLEMFYPHSRERAESIIEAMNNTRELLLSRFYEDSNFQECPEGFLFVYVDKLLEKMEDPITTSTIEKTIKNHFIDTRH